MTNERLEWNIIYAEAWLLWKTVELHGLFPLEGFATDAPIPAKNTNTQPPK